MPAAIPEAVVDQLRWRYAVKKFDPTRQIPADSWSALEQSLVLTPSSYGLQPWKFFVVSDPAVKAQLPAISWGQQQPKDCSHMVVFAVRPKLGESDIDRYLHRMAEVRDQPVESLAGFKQVMVGSLCDPFDVDRWAAHQVYIALGQFMACAAILAVDTCPMEGIEPERYDEVLGIGAQGYHTVVGCAAGYRAADDKHAQKPKVRFRPEDVIQVI
jgi:nitroreductase